MLLNDEINRKVDPDMSVYLIRNLITRRDKYMQEVLNKDVTSKCARWLVELVKGQEYHFWLASIYAQEQTISTINGSVSSVTFAERSLQPTSREEQRSVFYILPSQYFSVNVAVRSVNIHLIRDFVVCPESQWCSSVNQVKINVLSPRTKITARAAGCVFRSRGCELKLLKLILVVCSCRN